MISIDDILNEKVENKEQNETKIIDLNGRNSFNLVNSERSYTYDKSIPMDLSFENDILNLSQHIKIDNNKGVLLIEASNVTRLLYTNINLVFGGVSNTGRIVVYLFQNSEKAVYLATNTSSSVVTYASSNKILILSPNINHELSLIPYAKESSSGCHVYKANMFLKFI